MAYESCLLSECVCAPGALHAMDTLHYLESLSLSLSHSHSYVHFMYAINEMTSNFVAKSSHSINFEWVPGESRISSSYLMAHGSCA